MRQETTRPKLLLLLAEVLAFAVLATTASGHFGFADGCRITVAYFVAYLVPRVILTRSRDTSLAARAVLLVAALFAGSVDCLRLVHWTSAPGYTLQMPNIAGDARNYYKCALAIYYGNPGGVSVAFPGFPLLMAGLWKVFGLSAIWPQAMNLMFTLTSVVLTGMTTRRLLVGRVTVAPTALLAGGMLLTVMLVYYLQLGISMLKEGSTFISMAMAGYALSSMAADARRGWQWRDVLLFVLACALLALVRTTFLYFIALGVVVMTLPHWRRDWKMALAMLAVLWVALALGDRLSSYSFDRHAEIVGGGWNMQRYFVTSTTQEFFHKVIGYYFLYTPWRRLLLLPLTAAVQFLIPLPFFSPSVSMLTNLSKVTFGWYVVGGIALFYFVWMAWHRRAGMGAWAWWAALSFLALAYLMAGSVPRYVLFIEPLFVPVAMYVLCRLREGQWRGAFKWYAVCYVAVLAVVILLCLAIKSGVVA